MTACTVGLGLRRCAVACATVLSIAAAPALAAGPADAEMPLGAQRFDIQGGYKWDFVGGRKSDGWYRLMYRGVSLGEDGTPAQPSESIIVPPPAIDRSIADRADLALRFENGTLATAGGLFDAEGVRPITLAGLQRLDLRGTGFVATDRKFNQINAAIGIESPSLHPLGTTRGIANYLIVGLNAQHRETTDATTGDGNFATGTWRLFVGKAGYVERDTADVTQKVKAEFVKVGPNRDAANDAVAAAAKASQETGKPQSALIRLLGTAVRLYDRRIEQLKRENGGREPTSETKAEVWNALLDQFAEGRGKTKSEHPLWAVYAEASGWYEFRGARSDMSGRLKNLVTLSFDYWFMPGRDDVLFRLRYENGFERGVPGERKNQLLGSVALKF